MKQVLTQAGGDIVTIGGVLECPFNQKRFRLLAVDFTLTVTLQDLKVGVQFGQRGANGFAFLQAALPNVVAASGVGSRCSFAIGLNNQTLLHVGAIDTFNAALPDHLIVERNERVSVVVSNAVGGDLISTVVWTVEPLED